MISDDISLGLKPSGNIITSGNISPNPPRSGYINDKYIYTHIHIHTHIYTHTHIHTYTYTCLCVSCVVFCFCFSWHIKNNVCPGLHCQYLETFVVNSTDRLRGTLRLTASYMLNTLCKPLCFTSQYSVWLWSWLKGMNER